MLYDEAKLELDTTARDLQEMELKLNISKLETEASEEKFRQDCRRLSQERDTDKEELTVMQVWCM